MLNLEPKQLRVLGFVPGHSTEPRRIPLLVASEEVALIDVLEHPRLSDACSVEFVAAVEFETAGAAPEAAWDEREVGMDADEDALVMVPILVEVRSH